MPALSASRLLLLLLATAPLVGGCSIRSFASGKLADALSEGGQGYQRDDDPELVREAVPFGLKTMEQLLEDNPHHLRLLVALARGFTAYAYAFVEQDADRVEEIDVARGRELKVRARRLYLRGRDYGLRGLEVAHPGLVAALHPGGSVAPPKPTPSAGLDATVAADVPLLYWTAAAWTLAIAAAKEDMRLVGELPLAEKIMLRALALDERFDEGAIHEYFVAYDGSRSAAAGGGRERAQAHLVRALALSQNRKLGPLVSFAEIVSVGDQNKAEFRELLARVLAFDVDSDPPHRLANIVAQRRARWLLSRTDELFVD